MKYTDHTLMPFGKHKGKSLSNTPADYLLWLYSGTLKNQMLKLYIEENLELLQAEDKIIKAEHRIDLKNRYR